MPEGKSVYEIRIGTETEILFALWAEPPKTRPFIRKEFAKIKEVSKRFPG
jgi:hypothetical protein